MKFINCKLLCLLAGLSTIIVSGFAQTPNLGLFSNEADLGVAGKAGSVEVDSSTDTYRLFGSGEQSRLTNDTGHFIWKHVTADDLTLTAKIQPAGPTANGHWEASLMIRQSIAPDAVFVAAIMTENGHVSLKCRDTQGTPAHAIQFNLPLPTALRLEKHGDDITMSTAGADGGFGPAGGSFCVHLDGPFDVGLAVCSDTPRSLAAIQFSNVKLLSLPPDQANHFHTDSTLEIIDVMTSERRVVYQSASRLEAPNWSPDGTFLLFNSADRIWKLPLPVGRPQPINTGLAVHCGSNHGLSPDGALLAITDYGDDHKSRIFVLPATGGMPRQVSPDAPPYTIPETSGAGPSPLRRIVIPFAQTYWHGWSPDGKTIVYTSERDGENDVYALTLASGRERRLTTAPGIDDGPDYSPDGQHIYFSSERGGHMQLWWMKSDGSEQMPVTADDYNNWLPHPSPNGRWVVFLSYAPGVKGLPENEDVTLRLLEISSGRVRVLARLLGGHGTIDVPSWSPDSRQLAFVSYQKIYP